MIKKILAYIGIALFFLIAIILFKTFSSKQWPVKATHVDLQPLPDSALQHLSQAVQIRTISTSDTSSIDTAAFKAFDSFIDKSYPLIHAHLTKTKIDSFNYIFEWKGQNQSLAPIVLMGHYDVVPVEKAVADKWLVSPYSGKITD